LKILKILKWEEHEEKKGHEEKMPKREGEEKKLVCENIKIQTLVITFLIYKM